VIRLAIVVAIRKAIVHPGIITDHPVVLQHVEIVEVIVEENVML
jgi:hypothetical protein